MIAVQQNRAVEYSAQSEVVTVRNLAPSISVVAIEQLLITAEVVVIVGALPSVHGEHQRLELLEAGLYSAQKIRSFINSSPPTAAEPAPTSWERERVCVCLCVRRTEDHDPAVEAGIERGVRRSTEGRVAKKLIEIAKQQEVGVQIHKLAVLNESPQVQFVEGVRQTRSCYDGSALEQRTIPGMDE